MTTGLVYDLRFLEHDPGANHPECRERLSATITHLETIPWFDSLPRIKAESVDQGLLETIHERDYIRRAEEACLSGQSILDTMDVGICEESFRVALLASGSVLKLADETLSANISNGFAMVRPPGHHAEKDQALGFCLFNNVAVLARYLQKQYAIDKVLILDWDVHHGNGTQHAFEDDPSVLYISTHQYPYYPGTGAWSETGTGRGQGATLNCPMSAGNSDMDYERVFMEKILPKIDAFIPEFIVLSAGFDAHSDDPLAQICLSTDFFGWMTLRMMEMADKYCEGRIVSVLEGGYNLDVLPLCIAEHLRILSEN